MNKQSQKVLFGSDLDFASREAYKQLRTNIGFSFADEQSCHIIGIISAMKGEGKSLTSLNIAYSFAETRKRVLLIECDMRMPTMEKKLGFHGSVGLSNVLTAQMEGVPSFIYECVGHGEAPSPTFHVIFGGTCPPNPSELLESPRMQQLLANLSERYDYIFLDLPPVNVVVDGLAISKYADGMILIARQGYSIKKEVAKAIAALQFANVRLLGYVYNGVSKSDKKYGKKNRYYQYGYDYASNSKHATKG